MEIIMDFNKPSSDGKKIEKFLLDNLKTEEERETFTNVITGKHVLKKDVIDLMLSLLQAMTMTNEVNMDEFDKVNPEGEVSIEKNPPTPGSSGTQTDKKTENGKVATLKTKFNKGNVCYFYATNKCKFGKECRKEHPKICNKFKKYGLKKFNKAAGCNEECEFYHPMACFESMKTKTCKRTDCKFYHILGTKKEEAPNGNAQGYNINTQNTSNYGGVNNSQNITSNNTSTANNSQHSTQQSVFQVAKQPWELAIERMSEQMERMMILQQSFQTQIQPLLQPQRNLTTGQNPQTQSQNNWTN
jgi:hypothetical protein